MSLETLNQKSSRLNGHISTTRYSSSVSIVLVYADLSILPAKPDSVDQPFESIRYINGSIAAAWQMFHTVQMILELCRPNTGSSGNSLKTNIEIFAKRIVSNSISNRFPVAWVTAVQLLTSAGKWLVDPVERQAYALVLDNIKTRTGWNTIDSQLTEKK
jgi:hypothetical protein